MIEREERNREKGKKRERRKRVVVCYDVLSDLDVSLVEFFLIGANSRLSAASSLHFCQMQLACRPDVSLQNLLHLF